VFALEESEPVLVLDPTEVASAHWVALGPLRAGQHAGTYTYEVFGKLPIKLPCWRVDGNVIWGLTYRMLRRLLGLLDEAPA
jgi:hypothetical protein